MGSYERYKWKMTKFQTRVECKSKVLTLNLAGDTTARTSAPAGSMVAAILSCKQTLITFRISNITEAQGRWFQTRMVDQCSMHHVYSILQFALQFAKYVDRCSVGATSSSTWSWPRLLISLVSWSMAQPYPRFMKWDPYSRQVLVTSYDRVHSS
jgi:hypothetical protein